MKSYSLSITLAVAGLVRAGAEPPDPLEIHRHIVNALQSVHDKFPEPLKQFTEHFPPTALPREGMIMLAQANPAPPPADNLVDPAAIADWANNLATVTTRATLDGLFPRSAPRKPVIVGADTKARANLEEDLNVMMRILEKAAGTAKDETRPTAGGIELFSFGKSGGPRAFYLDGYGAMFVLNVRFPLLAPPQKDDQSHTNELANTEWEKAKEEVYGRRKAVDEIKFNAAPGEEFDSQRVEDLKTQLIDDLVNAKNIRGLKSDDYVTVVVLGGGTRGTFTRRVETHGPAGGRGGGARVSSFESSLAGSDANGAQSTMTLRAKKSDIDALAKGKLNTEEFRKKVSMQTY